MPSFRKEQVYSQLKREISVLINGHIAEEHGLITLTDIKLTDDFKEAVVYVSVFDQAKEADTLKALNAKTHEFQRVLGKKLKMKFTPRLEFRADHYVDKLEKVDKLLEEIKDES